MARLTCLLCVLTAAAFGARAQATPSGPPSGLTANGRVIWNLDALLNDTFGRRVPCFDAKRYVIFAVPHRTVCPSPEARYQGWNFTFLNAHHSAFRLIRLK